MARRFEIEDTITRQYSRFNASGTQLVLRLIHPSDGTDPISHYLASVNYLFRHAIQNLSESDVLGIMIQNRETQNDKPIRMRFRRKDQFPPDVILSLVQRFPQSNFRFKALDKLIMNVHSVRMPVGFGKHAIKSRGRPLSVMARLKEVS